MADREDGAFVVRRADSDEFDAVLGVLDGANLETDADTIRSALEHDVVLVAASERATILGALVLAGNEITHVAVRRRRRGQGIGTTLVDAAVTVSGADTLLARFDPGVRPFYEALGFEIERADDQDRRYVGRFDSDDGFDDLATGHE